MKKCREQALLFYSSAFYPLWVVVLVFMGHLFSMELLFGALLILSLIPAFFLCSDLRFAVMPFLSFVFIISAKGYSPGNPGYEERFLKPTVMVPAFILAALLVISIVFFCVRNKSNAVKRLQNAKFFYGLLAFSVILLLNGLFSANYTLKNFLFAFLFVLTLLGVYLLFTFYTAFDKNTVDYFFYCFFLASMLICAELVAAYFTTVEFVNGEIVKGSVVLGWGVWTTVGGMLAFLLPCCFYFAASHKHGWIAYGLGLFQFLCIVLSQSRGALLFGGGALVLSLICLLFCGENRKYNRIYTMILAIGAICVCVLYSDRVFGLIGNFLEFGFADNGRFEMWKIGWSHFLENPLLGSGFYDSYTTAEWERTFDPYLYHNTLIQLLGACGVLGMLVYAFHRLQTIKQVLIRPNTAKIFLGISILTLAAVSLLDVLFFKLYPTIFYALMLLCIENSEKEPSSVST